MGTRVQMGILGYKYGYSGMDMGTWVQTWVLSYKYGYSGGNMDTLVALKPRVISVRTQVRETLPWWSAM